MDRKHYALFLCLLMMTVPLTGCFGNSDDEDDDKPDPVTPPVLNEWSVHFAGTADDLPTCDDDTNGRLYYVEADNEFQVCKSTGWSVITIQGADGQDGVDGEDGVDGVDGLDDIANFQESKCWALGFNPSNDVLLVHWRSQTKPEKGKGRVACE